MHSVGNFHFLLAGLLVAILSNSILGEVLESASVIAQQALFSLTLLLGVWTLAPERRWFVLGMAMAAVEILLVSAALLLGLQVLLFPILLVSLAFCVMSALFAGYYVFVSETVDANRIAGALCVYLLLGVIWALLYNLIELSLGNAFTGLVGMAGEDRLRELTYYSFVTLTTLGYGDIVPVAPAAKTLAYLEAVAGQFYLTVLVAELVGVHVALRHSRHERLHTHASGPTPTVD